MLRRGARQERMPRAVALGAPVDVPTGVYQHRFAAHVPPAEYACVERPAGALRCADEDALDVRDSLKRVVRNVLAALVPVERRVDVGARVSEQLDLADLEGRAGGVAGLGCVAPGTTFQIGKIERSEE